MNLLDTPLKVQVSTSLVDKEGNIAWLCIYTHSTIYSDFFIA